jgi:hypothetical protein
MKGTITLTFCDCAENHVGMEQIGEKDINGFTIDDMDEIVSMYPDNEIIKYNLNPDDEYSEAYVYVIKKAVKNDEQIFNELKNMTWDTKFLNKGKVMNKKARYNLCFSNYSQEPDYENGKGRIIDYNENILLKKEVKKIHSFKGCNNFNIEGNYYYDIKKCGIGYHGDSERKKVIGIRFGETLSIYFQWFQKGEPIGDRFEIKLESGDMYIMSEKAVGNDWKKRLIYTLRHATGCDKYVNL